MPQEMQMTADEERLLKLSLPSRCWIAAGPIGSVQTCLAVYEAALTKALQQLPPGQPWHAYDPQERIEQVMDEMGLPPNDAAVKS